MSDERRAQFMARVAQLGGDSKWATSSNPVKQRIGQLEIAWREGLQGLMEDIRKMFQNFETVGDAYDTLDVNIAAVKSLLVEKGVFTEEEFAKRQRYLFGVLDKERRRRQAELASKLAEAQVRTEGKSADVVADKNIVDPGLVRLRDKAVATTDADHVPVAATMFGGS